MKIHQHKSQVRQLESIKIHQGSIKLYLMFWCSNATRKPFSCGVFPLFSHPPANPTTKEKKESFPNTQARKGETHFLSCVCLHLGSTPMLRWKTHWYKLLWFSHKPKKNWLTMPAAFASKASAGWPCGNCTPQLSIKGLEQDQIFCAFSILFQLKRTWKDWKCVGC